MTEHEMFERSFRRPKNFFDLTGEQQWEIDKQLGILDWRGENLTSQEIARFHEYYKTSNLVNIPIKSLNSFHYSS